MTQLGRPFQIALVAFGLLVLVWFVALRGHSPSNSSSSSSSGSTSSAPASSPPLSSAAQAKSPGAPTPVYHGPAPGLEGLTHAISKAHGAVAQSEHEAKRVEHEEPGSGASSSSSSGKASTNSGSKSSSSAAASASHAHAGAHAQGAGGAAKPSAPTVPAMQVTVEHELAQKKTALILFWNPKGSNDRVVHKEVAAASQALGSKVAVHYALAAQVGEFGTITRAVQVTQTPTLLIVNPHGVTTTVMGLTDTYAIDQSVAESHKAS